MSNESTSCIGGQDAVLLLRGAQKIREQWGLKGLEWAVETIFNHVSHSAAMYLAECRDEEKDHDRDH